MHAFDTPRLHLRPLREGDEALYCALYTDPGLMRNIAPPLSDEAVQRSFRAACRQQVPHPRRWIIHEREGNHEIGLLGLVPDDDTAEIGVMLLPGWDGRGFATESMSGMVDRVFSTRLVPRLCARQAIADNPPVNRLMLKLGFQPLPPDKAWSQRNWELDYDDWRALRGMALVAATNDSG
jgi:RimJ/RimL family protein N-acetyltransferase